MEIRNHSQLSPVSINGVPLHDKITLDVGDVVEVLGHKFVWARQENVTERNVISEDEEASYQIGAYMSGNSNVHSVRK